MTAQRMRNLGRQIVTAFEDRTADVTKLRMQTRSELHRFAKDRLHASKDQSSRLRRAHKDLTAGVKAQIVQLHAGRLAMAGEQRATLSASRTQLAHEEDRRAAAARTWLASVHSENTEVHDAWHSTTTQMAAKRAGAA